MNTVDNFNFSGEKVLLRVDFNVPLDAAFLITDDSRITAALPTINKILNDGGSVILMSHLGRPKEGPTEKYSLKHVVSHLSSLLSKPVKFATDCMGDDARQLSAELLAGEVLLLENLRFYKEEEKGDIGFSERLASYGTFYVNDAFGTAHRAHASTAVMAQFFTGKKAFGYLMAKEVENANQVMKSPQRPFTAIVGGAKVSDKILIVENLINIADHILIGGGMAYTFFKAQGGNIGNSLCEQDRLETCLEIMKKAAEKGVQIHLPLDSSKTILWNGPMGVFEMDAFAAGTRSVAEAVAESTENGAFSLIGGGDSAAAVYKFGFEHKVSYVSTGGGALLEYFEGRVLPGIAAIEA